MASWVYFVEHGGLVKIGYSASLRGRMAVIPGRLRAVEPGGVERERELHERFADLREGRSEWFRAEPELMGYVSEMAAEHDMAAALVVELRPIRLEPPEASPELTARIAEVKAGYLRAMADREAVRADRDAMVAELRAAGWGYDRIANALGMTKSRVQQLCR